MLSLKQVRNLMAGLLAFAVCSTPVFAGENYYRWVDEQGTEVNSDQPPPAGVKYEVIKVKRSMTVPVTEEETSVAGESESTPPSKQRTSPPPLPEMVPVKNSQACAAARKNLETLNSFARIRIPDGKGSYRYIDEKEKAEQRAQAEASIAANCE